MNFSYIAVYHAVVMELFCPMNAAAAALFAALDEGERARQLTYSHAFYTIYSMQFESTQG